VKRVFSPWLEASATPLQCQNLQFNVLCSNHWRKSSGRGIPSALGCQNLTWNNIFNLGELVAHPLDLLKGHAPLRCFLTA